MISISPHCHPESAWTGSTVEALVGRAKEMGRTHFSYTDLGHLSSCLKAYGFCKPDKRKTEDLAKIGKAHLKKELKFAAGLEFFFKDPKDPLIFGTNSDKSKYFNASVFGKTQEAYQEMVRIVSRTDMPKIEVQEETQSLWSWSELEHISKFETLLVLGGPHCPVGKVFLADGKELAEKVFLKLKDLFGSRLSVSLICEKWDKKFATVIKVTYEDGTHDSLLGNDIVSTDKARKIKASDLFTRGGHKEILSKITGSTYFKVGKKIQSVTEHKGFLPLPLDVTLEINKFLLEMSKKHGVLALVSDYSFYADKSDHIVQTMVLENTTKIKADLHMRTEEEFLSYLGSVMGLSQEESKTLIQNNNEWAKNFDNFQLKYEYRLADSGGNPLQQCMDIIKKIGRMKWDDPVYTARLREEIGVISKNGVKDFSAYFLPICDIVTHYRENGRLTGPARGSAGGSLFCYLLGITQIDPIRYGLSFPRFLSLDRIKNGDIPDVDTDFPDRELLVGEDGKSGYIYKRWGNKAAQISTRHKVRLKSSIKDTNRYFKGSVEKEIENFAKSLPESPQGVPDSDFVFGYEDSDGNHLDGLIEISSQLKDYVEKRPAEWQIVQKALGITRAHSMHASAFAISDIPISDILPTKEGHITQYEAKQVETCGILKYDLLTVSNIKDIEVCLKLINKKNKESPIVGHFSHNGKLEYIWDLPYDLEAFKSCWDGNTETLFQVNTKTMSPAVKDILPKSVEDYSTILALKRPGPMDYTDEKTGRTMDNEYVWRRQGKSKSDFQELNDLISETYGVLVFQEQVLKISKELGGMSPSDAEKLRRLFSKKLKKEAGEMKPIFMSTAVPKIGEEKANKIWDMMETSSRYSFNLSHSLAYALITYAGIFLKHNYPLEWWTAILSNAKQNEITGKLWPHVKHLLASPDINLSSDEMEIDYANNKIRSKLGVIRGMGEKSIDPIVSGRPYKDIQDFVNREVAGPGLTRKLTHVGVLDSLYPPKLGLLEKLQLFEDALETKKFNKAKSEGKLIKQLEPKKGQIPEEYLNIEKDPMKNAAVQKSILPSLLVGLHDLGRHYSKCITAQHKPSRMMTSPNGQQVLLVTGEMLQRLDEMQGDLVPKDAYIAVTAFIVDTEVFDYKKNTKQALKAILDSDSYISEKVLWPDYFNGELNYPKELKKGSICTVFLKKRANKNDPCSITEIVIEKL